MTEFVDVIALLEEKFGLEVESQTCSNASFVRIHGIDNCSLAEYIREEYDDLIVSAKHHKEHQFCDTGWIKLEKK